jgi:hypothetical protein
MVRTWDLKAIGDVAEGNLALKSTSFAKDFLPNGISNKNDIVDVATNRNPEELGQPSLNVSIEQQVAASNEKPRNPKFDEILAQIGKEPSTVGNHSLPFNISINKELTV